MKTVNRVPKIAPTLKASASEEFARNINVLIEAEDYQKKQYQDQILDQLKLTQQRAGEIQKVLHELLQLGYAGLIDTLQIFAKAVNFAVTPHEESAQDFRSANKKVLFENEVGRDILRRIIWCSSHEDQEVSQNATIAITALCQDFAGLCVCLPSSCL
jgi:hypothetical protein